MSLQGSPSRVLAEIAKRRRSASHSAPPSDQPPFDSRNVRRFAVSRRPNNPRVVISADDFTMAAPEHYAEVGRIGVLPRDNARSLRHLLVLHDPNIVNTELHVHIARLSLAMCCDRERVRTDVLLPAARGLVRHGRARVSLYTSHDHGLNWEVADVTSVLNDFAVGDHGRMEARVDTRRDFLSIDEFLECVTLRHPAIKHGSGKPADPRMVLPGPEQAAFTSHIDEPRQPLP